MTALVVPIPSPTATVLRWTGARVKARLKEAFAIEGRMPGEGIRRPQSAWPAQPMHSFADVVGWDNAGDGPSDRVLEAWAHARGAMPAEVSMMNEAQDWLRWLTGDEHVWLQAWAAAKGRGLKVRGILRKRKISRTSFYRTVDRAAQRIADRLNERGVGVR